MYSLGVYFDCESSIFLLFAGNILIDIVDFYEPVASINKISIESERYDGPYKVYFDAFGYKIKNGDMDGDTILDKEEVRIGVDGYITDPNRDDTDGDTISDDDEIFGKIAPDYYLSDPTKIDGDFDLLTDAEEIYGTVGPNFYKSDPLMWDTDGDGYDDYYETLRDKNPRDDTEYPIMNNPPQLTCYSDGHRVMLWNLDEGLSWNTVSDAAKYHIQFTDDDAGFTPSSGFPSVSMELDVFDTHFDTSGFSEGIYYWSVKAIDYVGGSSDYAQYRSFEHDFTPHVKMTLHDDPSNNARIADPKPTFHWDAVSDPDNDLSFYEITISGPSGDLYLGENVGTVTSQEMWLPLDVEGIWNWKIRAVDDVGNRGPYSDSNQFTFDQSTTPTLGLPDDEAGFGIGQELVTFTWNSIGSGNVQYHIEIDDDPNFGSVGQDEQATLTGTSKDFTLSDGTYYWHVEWIDEDGYSADLFSETREFTVDTIPPGIPNLVSPSDNYRTNDIVIDTSWSSVADAESYQIEYSFTDIINSYYINYVDNQYSQLGLSTYIPFFAMTNWKIEVLTGSDTGSIYTIDTPISTPPLLIFWNEVIPDITGETIKAYGIYDIPSGTTKQLALAEGLFSWKVRSLDGVGNPSDWSIPNSFTIDTTPPGSFALTSPNSGTRFANSLPLMQWGSAADADHYLITLTGPSGDVYTDYNTGSDQFFVPLTPLTEEGSYDWQVKAIDDVGNVRNSATNQFDFDLSTIPSSVTVPSPTNDQTPTINWADISGVDHYEIQIDSLSPEYPTLSEFTTGSLDEGVHTYKIRWVDEDNVPCPVWYTGGSFEIDLTPPDTPSLTSPSGWVTDPDVVLSWSGSGANYDFQIATSTTNWNSVTGFPSTYDDGQTTSQSYGPYTYADDTYYWSVKQMDDAGNWGDYAPYMTFTIDTIIPGTPYCENSGRRVANPKPYRHWTSVSDAHHYLITITKPNGQPFDVYTNYNVGSGTQWTPSVDMVDTGIYDWKVRAVDTAGNLGNWGSASFIFDKTSTPFNPSPIDGFGYTAGNRAPLLGWGYTAGSSISGYSLIIDGGNPISLPLQNSYQLPTQGYHKLTWKIAWVDYTGTVCPQYMESSIHITDTPQITSRPLNNHHTTSGSSWSVPWTPADVWPGGGTWRVYDGSTWDNQGSWSTGGHTYWYTTTPSNGITTYTAEFSDGWENAQDSISLWKHDRYEPNSMPTNIAYQGSTGGWGYQGSNLYNSLRYNDYTYAWTNGAYGNPMSIKFGNFLEPEIIDAGWMSGASSALESITLSSGIMITKAFGYWCGDIQFQVTYSHDDSESDWYMIREGQATAGTRYTIPIELDSDVLTVLKNNNAYIKSIRVGARCNAGFLSAYTIWVDHVSIRYYYTWSGSK